MNFKFDKSYELGQSYILRLVYKYTTNGETFARRSSPKRLRPPQRLPRSRKRLPPPEEFITEQFLEQARVSQLNRCASCSIDMQVYNRKLPSGLTIQRKNNGVGHSKSNCCLMCHRCNVRRVESGLNKDYVRETRAKLYFERLINDGYAKLDQRECLYS